LALPSHLEKQANEIQRENTMLGVYEGEIVAALDKGIHYESTTLLNRVCAKQLWECVLNRSLESIKVADVKRINTIIETHKDYEKYARTRFDKYGMVVVYERKNHLEKAN